MNTVFSFILVLGVLIFVHELGHFLFAKLFHVKVLRFSLGFGPKMFGKTVGETEYVISLFPLGGYVKMVGQGDIGIDQVDEDMVDRAYSHKPVWQRFFIILAGPMFNLLLPVLLFFFLFSFQGVPESMDNTTIGTVTEGSPAAEAGLEPGDTILAIDGRQTPGWLDVLNGVKQSGGEQIVLTIIRGHKQLDVAVLPKIDSAKNVFGEEVEQRYMIGIMHEERVHWEKISFFQAIQAAFLQTWGYLYLTVMSFIKLFQQVIPASELGGPILIAKLAGEQMRAGWINMIYFMSLLSVNLGILNLLPVPVLDGGHLVFLSYEGIFRKPMSERVQVWAQQLGLALLVTLMLFVFYNDIARLFQ